MTAVNVVLVLAPGLFIIVISGRGKRKCYCVSAFHDFCVSGKLAVTELQKIVLFPWYETSVLQRPVVIAKLRFTAKRFIFENDNVNTKLDVRTNFHLALVTSLASIFGYHWQLKFFHKEHNLSIIFNVFFFFNFERITSLSEKSFQFILKFVLDYPCLI